MSDSILGVETTATNWIEATSCCTGSATETQLACQTQKGHWHGSATICFARDGACREAAVVATVLSFAEGRQCRCVSAPNVLKKRYSSATNAACARSDLRLYELRACTVESESEWRSGRRVGCFACNHPASIIRTLKLLCHPFSNIFHISGQFTVYSDSEFVFTIHCSLFTVHCF